MQNRSVSWALAAAVCLALAFPPAARCVPTQAAAADPNNAPTPDQLRNATYDGIFDTPVTLTDGHFEGAPFMEGGASRPRVVYVDRLGEVADLDGDGAPEAVVLLAASAGGSGTRVYVAVVTTVNGAARNVGTALLGDRVQVRSVRVVGAAIHVDVVEQGPGDAACCPTQLAHRTWELASGALVERQREIHGTLSIEVLAGTTWVLREFEPGVPVSPDVEVTLEFEAERVTGSSGCNRYFASFADASSPDDGPAALRFAAAATTRRACPSPASDVENTFLDRLSRVTQFGFRMGQLALSWNSGEQYGTLLFDAR